MAHVVLMDTTRGWECEDCDFRADPDDLAAVSQHVVENQEDLS